jgi:hypothetical protein
MRGYFTLPALVLASLLPLAVTSCGGASPSSPPPNPVFLSSPPSAADEGSPYVYTMQASDPASGGIYYHLTIAPAGAAISGATVTWIPTGSQPRQLNSFAVTATTAAGGSAVQSWSVTPTGVIHITWIVTRVLDKATRRAPLDLSSEILAAVVPNGAGGFDRIDGRGFSDGTGSIAHVPAGFFWFDLDENTFIWTSASNLDVSLASLLGRADLGDLFPNPSALSLSISGLNPWQTTDQLQWRVTNAGFGGDGNRFEPGPSTGATTFAVSLAPFFDQLDASKGDQQVINQLVTHAVGGWQFLTLDKAFGPVPISVPDATPVSINAAMSDPPRSSVRANFGSGFQSLVTAINPRAVAFSTGIELRVEPGPTPHEPSFSGPQLAVFDLLSTGLGVLTSDLDLGDVCYGNPYDSSWPVFFHYLNNVSVPYAPPGLPAAQIVAGVEGYTTNLPTATSPLQPIVGPPVNLRINGVDFFQDQTAVGLMPTLQYGIGFCFFLSHPNASMCNGFLITNTTTVTVPPGVLLAGKQYFVRVTAISQPGLDASTAPFKTAFPRGTADALGSHLALKRRFRQPRLG